MTVAPSKRCLNNSLKTRFTKVACATLGILSASIATSHAQQVALLDAPVSEAAGLNLIPGFNYFLDSDDTDDTSMSDQDSHGTIVTRIVSESFDGELIPLVITDGDLTGENEGQVRTARNAALEGLVSQTNVNVVGITWNSDGVIDTSSPFISQLSDAGKVITILAGDDGADEPNALARSSFSQLGVIIVGASDASGELLDSTNRAGSTLSKYVVIDGAQSVGAETGDTSFATARLSGIAGAVFAQNPNLTASEVVDIILQSAEDRGDEGVDEIYGRGFIRNAQQVLNNVIGPVTVPTPAPDPTPTPTPPEPNTNNGGGGGGGGAVLLLGGALAGALLLLKKPADKLEKTLVLDSYGRSFEANLNNQIEINDGTLELNQFFHSLNQQANGQAFSQQLQLSSLRTNVAFQAAELIDPRIDFIEYFASPNDKGIEAINNTLAFSVSTSLSDSLGFTAAHNVDPKQEFGATKRLTSNANFGSSSFLSGQNFSSMLSGFSAQANTSSLTYSPMANDKATIKLGLVSVDEETRFKQQSFSSLLQGEYQFDDNAGLSVQFGQIQEKGSVLGGGSRGVFGVNGAVTHAINLAGNIKLGNSFNLLANYGIGRTSVDTQQNSLLQDFTRLRSSWYSLGVVGNNVWRKKDQFGFAISQPLKIESGTVNYSIPVTRLSSGGIGFDSERVNLADTNATEHTLDVYYRTMLTEKFEMGAFMSYRQNPNHVSDHGDDAVVMATIRFWQ